MGLSNIKGSIYGLIRVGEKKPVAFDPFPDMIFSVNHDYARSGEVSVDIFGWDSETQRQHFDAEGMTVSAVSISYPVAEATVTPDGYYVYTHDGQWPETWDAIEGSLTITKGAMSADYPFHIIKSAS